MRNSFLKTLTVTALLAGAGVLNSFGQFTTTTQIGGGALGSITVNSPGSYTVVGGGNDIWDAGDEFTFHYAPVSGDFDVKIRVESLDPVARWTKGGLMLRESTAGASRMAFSRVTPAQVQVMSARGSTSAVAGDVVKRFAADSAPLLRALLRDAVAAAESAAARGPTS